MAGSPLKAATFSSSAIGPATGSLLAGNFGDGRINVLAKHGARYTHQVTGQVRDTSTGKLFAKPGLWGLLGVLRPSGLRRRSLSVQRAGWRSSGRRCARGVSP